MKTALIEQLPPCFVHSAACPPPPRTTTTTNHFLNSFLFPCLRPFLSPCSVNHSFQATPLFPHLGERPPHIETTQPTGHPTQQSKAVCCFCCGRDTLKRFGTKTNYERCRRRIWVKNASLLGRPANFSANPISAGGVVADLTSKANLRLVLSVPVVTLQHGLQTHMTMICGA